MKISLIAAAAAFALATQAQAVTVRDCDGSVDRVVNIAEPWSENTRQFYNKQVRVTLVDTGGEPVCCSAHLVVTFPSAGQDEPVYSECKIVSAKDSSGFLSIGFPSLTASYNAKTGLDIAFPYTTYNDSGENHPKGVAKLRLNLKTGTLSVVK